MPANERAKCTRPATGAGNDIAATRGLLVVDDDPDLRFMVTEALMDEGWDARGAASGKEALDLLETWRPDVILLDVILSEMPSRDFRAELDAIDSLRSIPVVVTSGVADIRLAASALRAAAALPKPFTIDRLAGVVGKLLDGAGEQHSPPTLPK